MSAPEAPMHSTRWLCYGAMICLALSTNLPPVLLTTFSDTFGGATGLNEEAMGRIPGALFFAMIFGILLAGPLADRFGLRTFTLVGLAALALGFATCALAPTFTLLLLAMALLGIGVGTLEVVLSPIIANITPHNRAAALNKLHFFYCAGALLAVALITFTHQFDVPWRLTVGATVTLPILIALGFLFTPILNNPLREEAHTTTTHVPYGSIFFLLCLCTIALSGGTEVSMAQWLPAFAERELEITKTNASIALGIFSILMGLGRIIIIIFIKRIAPETLMIASAALAACCYLATGLAPFPILALSAATLTGLFAACLWPNTLAITANRFPHGGSTMYGLLAAGGNAGCVLFPWLIGYMATHTSLRIALTATTLCPILLLIVLLWLRSHKEQTT